MVSSNLTVEELLQIASIPDKELTTDEKFDKFMEDCQLGMGDYIYSIKLFYQFYVKKSINPILFDEFCVRMKKTRFCVGNNIRIRSLSKDSNLMQELILEEYKKNKKRKGKLSKSRA